MSVSLFAPQVMCKVVRECQRVYHVHVDHLQLYSNAMWASFGRLGFILRDIQERSVIELLITVENPLPVANALMRLISESVALLMPSLAFALAIPADTGGRWSQGDRVYEKQFHDDSVLVILDGEDGLAEHVKRGGRPAGVVYVGPSRQITCSEAQEKFKLWLKCTGTLDWYDLFISYGRKAPFDSWLASAICSQLSFSVVGTRPVRVFLNHEQIGSSYSRRDMFQALQGSRIAVMVVSWCVLRSMQNLNADSEPDEVLLDWILALELLAAGRLHQCLPIVLGAVGPESATGGFHATRLVQEGAVELLPAVVCAKAVADVSRELLTVGLSPSKKLSTRTVRETAEELLSYPREIFAASGTDQSAYSVAEWERQLAVRCANKAIACIDETLPSDKVR